MHFLIRHLQSLPALGASALLVLAQSAHAQLTNPLQAESLEELIADILHAVVQLGAIALVLALVWTGFLFVQAQGNEEKIRSARGALMWTVIGGLLLLGAEAIAQVIRATAESL